MLSKSQGEALILVAIILVYCASVFAAVYIIKTPQCHCRCETLSMNYSVDAGIVNGTILETAFLAYQTPPSRPEGNTVGRAPDVNQWP
jgi:hypothetical protein